ncbi:hypothetical protein PO397_00900 [Bacteroides ovatus]|jgi:hypothetical protein|uniref:Uncharacterized protein n=2 Tax=Bacteroides TaxID=816 RepID=W6P3X9_9BACE|nr:MULTISPECIES: hypothetical protein [Bacteroides]MCS3175341.1 hypothetical protein [Candidatus Bacteroides intestinigallinarum]MDC2770811.1 hypothetical protein [Bacteroides ovatus]MDC2780170.1 hypothetical protein [Bacteroides ovatus]MDC2785101.1 hypothetical protein [Bacteroides ovatus]MDC2789966.1 hypothetical protein [Bacteroides ovatus]
MSLTVQHFNGFCKKYLGDMPGNLWKAMDERKKKKKRIKGT